MKGTSSILKLSILGLLSISPMTGYELHKNFKRSLHMFWPVPLTQIYPILRVMESEDLITREVILQEKKPNKNLYSLTEKGHDELLKWLKKPSKLKIMQHEFLHKLFLYNLISTKSTLGLIREYKRENENLLNQFINIREKFSPSLSSVYSESAKFQLLSLNHLIRLTQVEIDGAIAIEEELMKTVKSNEPKQYNSSDTDVNDIIF